MLGITIRIGASHDQIETKDGTVFDRATMTRSDKKKLARLIREFYRVDQERT